MAPRQSGLERIEAFFTGHAYDPHRHDTYAIGYTVHGVQEFHYRGARTASSTGHAMVLHPDERHDGESGIEEGFCYRMLYLAPRLVRDALGDRAQALPFARAAVADDPRLIRALRPAFDDMDHLLEDLQADHLVLAIAEALLARDPSAGKPRAMSADGTAIERVRQFLDAHFDRMVTSRELEAVADLDRFTLARQFRKRLGTSPYRYLTMRRLDRARSTIAAGQALADVAVDCGFADQSHMTRQFKQAYGMSPGRWQVLQASR
ncbi:MAG TPA: AraC family transcriptional regulator [Dongiaceae bacterium]